MDAGLVLGRALGKDLAGAGLALICAGPALAWHWSALDRHEDWAADLDGDILRAGVHSLPVGDTLRVGGQDSGPRRRRTPPAGRTRTRPRGMSPDGAGCPGPEGRVPGWYRWGEPALLFPLDVPAALRARATRRNHD